MRQTNATRLTLTTLLLVDLMESLGLFVASLEELVGGFCCSVGVCFANAEVTFAGCLAREDLPRVCGGITTVSVLRR